ncbi:hypothetical protein [Paraburkholderia phenoliruptrix]|uniref:hypothetical protein n=1 Tax=Paraburkholderia phenoliruptrix TaxID=252970 RepID=UPI001C6E630F|nr:hypothetical protein [Paraburkholderia phenoliruptrix]MBW9102970.1 hypothetical protein [Paraburkholderia phenoliruptrix]MBW9132944.1 hypothetical protein [Paraburkholderia ginsengiterrae]
MKRKYMLLAAGLLSAVALVGCQSIPTQTPAQIAANICPGVQSEIDVLTKSGVFTGGAQATLTNQVQPDVDAVCAAGATVTTVSIQKLVQATFPVVLTVISNSNLTDQQKLQATVAVGAIVTGINTALSLRPVTANTALGPDSMSAVLITPAPPTPSFSEPRRRLQEIASDE